MFCSHCGKKLKDGVVFCENCGKLTEVQSENSQYASVKSGQLKRKIQILELSSYGISILGVFLGLMKWIQIRIPLLGEWSGSYHIWNLVSLLKDFSQWTGEKDFAKLSFIVAIPFVFWLFVLFFTGTGFVVHLIVKNKKLECICLIVAFVSMILSGGIYLFIVFWLKNQIEELTHYAIGVAVGGNLIQVSVFPWLMLLFGVVGVILSCFQLFHRQSDVFQPSLDSNENADMENNQKNAHIGLQLNAVNLEMQDLEPEGILIFQDKNDSSKVYGCDLANSVLVGRDVKSCNIVIEGEATISRQHCRFFKQGMMCYVEDMKSYNHTYVNGKMLQNPVQLKKGDCLRLGNLEFVISECNMAGKL